MGVRKREMADRIKAEKKQIAFAKLSTWEIIDLIPPEAEGHLQLLLKTGMSTTLYALLRKVILE